MKKNLSTYVYLSMILVVFILPFFSMEGYSIIKNTTSQLGAQLTPNAWLMNTVFFLLGLTYAYEFLRFNQLNWTIRIMVFIFGASLIGTAIFSHAPIDSSLVYNAWEDKLHSFFATVTGFSFVASSLFISIFEKNVKLKIYGLSAAGFSILMSLLIFTVSDYMGLWQRIMFLISFFWLSYYLEVIHKR
jgi:hypothetical membrane protein